MSEKRTIIDWLLWAKYEGYYWADNAINNIKKEDSRALKREVESLEEALSSGFLWRNSNEKLDYWLEVKAELNSLNNI